ncbi:MAG: GPR endopeptidase [Firmicutes bacterium]|nr:GPR endopeptidase [Bacillota bacterium]
MQKLDHLHFYDREPVARFDDDFYGIHHVRTDLAMEATEVIVEREGPPEIAGVVVANEETDVANINRTNIQTEGGARTLGKARGNYVTIESQALRQHNRQALLEVSELIAGELEDFFGDLGDEDPILVVGLGNWNATPDALGPRVINKLLVTRHLFTFAPPELRGGLRPVAAISPGVLGITGIETGETILGIVDRVKPKLIICIDALASRSTERLCTTIQIADSGIHPGSGIGNMRMGITQDTMGVPVLAIGVPTVIHAVTLISDGMEMIAKAGGNGAGQKADSTVGSHSADAITAMPKASTTSSILDPQNIRMDTGRTPSMEMGAEVGFSPSATADQKIQQLGKKRASRGGTGIDDATKRQVIRKLLEPYMGTMVVTPKEIDVLMADAAWVVAAGLNIAMHPGMDPEQAAQYTV